ncbi:unnamed protein product [Parnassius apollo]|uniref:(apollo) hypothetical protein n=1 Tax=Parnassius apollo TaxID=110799 RepID=A0A8S3Y5K6_PARAO|nr:unnamed protein product [Parnassius apollo]
MQVLEGWRPGAISKRLMKKLYEAKRKKSVVEEIKQIKKAKKRIENKPTLMISKRDGEYRVEIQTTPAFNVLSREEYSPLIYRIAKADNEDRIKKKNRIKRRLVRRATNDIWIDNNNTKDCDNVCLEAYKQAVGLPNSGGKSFENHCSELEAIDMPDSCFCSDNDISSSCASSEVDWEIHFSPPSACLT